MESGEITTRPASLDPPDPINYTIDNYFEFADFKTVAKNFHKILFYRYLDFNDEEIVYGI